MQQIETSTIVEKMKDSPCEDIQALIGKGLIPLRFIGSSTPTFNLWNVNKKALVSGVNQSQSGFKYLVGTTLNIVINKEDLEKLSTFSLQIEQLTTNPFTDYTFYKVSDYYDGATVNQIKYSKYHRELKPTIGNKEISLLLKSIRINDKITLHNFSLTEIIIAWQTFHNAKIMAIPCIYSEDRGIGKTTLMLAGGYLYDNSEKDYFTAVNMGDANKVQWGDYEIGTRTVVFDDIPNHTATIKAVENKIKSSATFAGDIQANKKGAGMVKTNAYNQAVTTNSLYAIPLDGAKDRRIHPINIHASDFTGAEKKQIEKMKIPMAGNKTEHFPIMQDILNHLKHVYDVTKSDNKIYNYLMKETPVTEFKKEVARARAGYSSRFAMIISQSATMTELLQTLEDEYGEEAGTFNWLRSSHHAIIEDGRLHLFSNGIKSIGSFFHGENISASKAVREYFKSMRYKTTRFIEFKPTKALSFDAPLLKEEVPLIITNENGKTIEEIL